MNCTTDGEFPTIERRVAIAARVEGVKARVPASHLLPSRLIGWAALLSYHAERLYRRLRGEF